MWKTTIPLLKNWKQRLHIEYQLMWSFFPLMLLACTKNIDTNHGMKVTDKFVTKFKDEIQAEVPIVFLQESLHIIMSQNTFQFEDTFWLQLIWYTMGTLAVVNYSYLYVGLLEMTSLLVNFKEYLLFFHCFFDNGLGVWNCLQPRSEIKFQEFMSWLNNWGKLKLTNTGFVNSLQFLDLTISIKDDKLHFKTFQKEHNLYLYIPLCLFHSPDMVFGLIRDSLQTYYKHNINEVDYISMAIHLAENFLGRGWKWDNIRPIFQDNYYCITDFHKKQSKSSKCNLYSSTAPTTQEASKDMKSKESTWKCLDKNYPTR